MDTHAQPPILLTVKAAVAFSGISRAELYRRMSAGKLKRKKIGRSTMIRTADLLSLIENLPS